MRRVLWSLVILVAIFHIIDLNVNLPRASGAPQQAALAAMAAAWMIAVYLIARASESLVAIQREKKTGPQQTTAEDDPYPQG